MPDFNRNLNDQPMDTARGIIGVVPSLNSFDQAAFERMLFRYADTLTYFADKQRGISPFALRAYGRAQDGYADLLKLVSPYAKDMTMQVLCTNLQQVLDKLEAVAQYEGDLRPIGEAKYRAEQADQAITDKGLVRNDTTRMLLTVLCALFNLSPDKLPDDYLQSLRPAVPLDAQQARERMAGLWRTGLTLDWRNAPEGELFCDSLVNDQDAGDKELNVTVRLPDGQDHTRKVILHPWERLLILRVGEIYTSILRSALKYHDPMIHRSLWLQPDRQGCIRYGTMTLEQVKQLSFISHTTRKPRYLRTNGTLDMGDPRLQVLVGEEGGYDALLCADLAFVAIRKAGGIVTNIPALKQPNADLCALAVYTIPRGKERIAALLRCGDRLTVWDSNGHDLSWNEFAHAMFDTLS